MARTRPNRIASNTARSNAEPARAGARSINPSWVVRTGRLTLRPVAAGDLVDLQLLKADPRAFAQLLGGVRTPMQTARELAEDISFWSARGFGIFAVRATATGRFVGITGLMARADGRGIALRFALSPQAHGHGYGAEAAGAALRFGHDRGGLRRIVAVAQETNTASRMVLGAIGMQLCDRFEQDGVWKLEYESIAH